MKGGREATMYTENFRGYNSSNGKAVEDVNEGSPRLDVTASFAFVIEAINCIS